MNSWYVLIAILFINLLYIPLQAQGQDNSFESDGVTIRYKVMGQGPPVILVHGYTTDIEHNWGKVIPVLADRFQVIGLDLRGHGKSDKPYQKNKYGEQMGLDIIRLMNHLGIEKAHVVGYSLGGIIS